MSSLVPVTRCPFCETTFRVTETQLNAARGAVRCGACLQVFQAPEHFVIEEQQFEETLSDNPGGDQASPDGDERDTAEGVPQSYLDSADLDSTGLDSADAPPLVAETIGDGESQKPHIETDVLDPLALDPLALDPGGLDTETMDPDATATVESASSSITFGSVETQQDPGTSVSTHLSVDDPDDGPKHDTPPEGNDLGGADTGLETEAENAELVTGRLVQVQEQAADATAAGTLESLATADVHNASESEAADDPFDDRLPEDVRLDFELPAPVLALDETPSRAFPWGWLGGSLMLLLVAILQYAWFNVPTLANEPALRPYVLVGCRLVSCVVPEFVDPSALRATDLVIRSHPGLERSLLVDAVIANRAPFRQAFPMLELRFTSLNETLVAARAFRPDEYLGGEMSGLKYIPGSTEVRISLEIVDPGPGAASYELLVL